MEGFPLVLVRGENPVSVARASILGSREICVLVQGNVLDRLVLGHAPVVHEEAVQLTRVLDTASSVVVAREE